MDDIDRSSRRRAIRLSLQAREPRCRSGEGVMMREWNATAIPTVSRESFRP
jgi:hypothetical protein